MPNSIRKSERKLSTRNVAARTSAKAPSKSEANTKPAKPTKTATLKKAARVDATPTKSAAGKTTAPRAASKPPSASKLKAAKPVATKAAKDPNVKASSRSGADVAKKVAPVKVAPAKVASPKAISKPKPDTVQVSNAPTPAPFRPPTRDEAAALQAFERARKEFTSGHFGEARDLFRKLIEKFSGVAEVKARARTYLAVTETRLRADKAMPKDSEELYNRGVVELNRGDYALAQELFERSLRRVAASPATAAHAHYGLAAARARLGTFETALAALERALTLQPSLRARAQYDSDLVSLRSTPEFESLVTATRE